MNIDFHLDVYKQLQRVPRPTLAAALKVIIGLKDDPRPPGSTKLAGSINDWRARIGEYRVIWRINDSNSVTVLRVTKRGEAYE